MNHVAGNLLRLPSFTCYVFKMYPFCHPYQKWFLVFCCIPTCLECFKGVLQSHLHSGLPKTPEREVNIQSQVDFFAKRLRFRLLHTLPGEPVAGSAGSPAAQLLPTWSHLVNSCSLAERGIKASCKPLIQIAGFQPCLSRNITIRIFRHVHMPIPDLDIRSSRLGLDGEHWDMAAGSKWIIRVEKPMLEALSWFWELELSSAQET